MSQNYKNEGESIPQPQDAPPLPVFTDEELQQIAARHGYTLAALPKRLIMQFGDGFFLMNADGEYGRPFYKKELPVRLPYDLRRFPSVVPGSRVPEGYIVWDRRKGEDTIVPKTIDEMIRDYATVPSKVVASLTVERSYYDAANDVFWERAAPFRQLEPKYDEQIDRWLRLLSGPSADKLLDCVATVRRIDKPSCGVVITGPPGIGKEMLVQGLARLWQVESPSELGRVLDGFNDTLMRCPIVFCDERLPDRKGGRKAVLGDLRSLIAQTSRTLARKFLPTADLVGAVRVFIAANNPNILASSEEMTPDDQKAIAGRYLHIAATPAAGEYLASIGGRAKTEAWVNGLGIARHAAWLAENRKVVPGGRYLVEPDDSGLIRQMVMAHADTSLVLQWIARHLDAGAPSYRWHESSPIVGDGKILINGTGIYTRWDDYIKSTKAPLSIKKIGGSLNSIAIDQARVTTAHGGKQKEVKYHVVDPTYVYDWAEQSHVGNVGAMKDLVTGSVAAARGVVRRGLFEGIEGFPWSCGSSRAGGGPVQ